MRGKVTAITLNEPDRTADMTVEVYTDTGTLVETDNVILPIDIVSRALATRRISELLTQVIVKRATFPYTQASIDALLKGMWVIVPE